MKLTLLHEAWRRIPYDKLASRLAEAVVLKLKRLISAGNLQDQTFVISGRKGSADLSDEAKSLIWDVFGDTTLQSTANEFTLRVGLKRDPREHHLRVRGRTDFNRAEDVDIDVEVTYPDALKLQSLSTTYDQASELLRHELEHLRQLGVGEVRRTHDRAMWEPKKAAARGLIPSAEFIKYASGGFSRDMPLYDWFTTDLEIGAKLTDLHFDARRKGKPFEEMLHKYLYQAVIEMKRDGVPNYLVANAVQKFLDFAMKKYPGLIKKRIQVRRPELEPSAESPQV